MKVHITLDRYDGSLSKIVTTDLGGISMSELAFRMMSPDVCGITITKADKIDRLLAKLEKSKEVVHKE